MEQWTIYYNPRCKSCQDALKLLKEKGIRPVVIEYLKNPPSVRTLNSLLRKLRVSPMEIIRTKEPIFETLKLGAPGKSREDLLRAISEHPVLLQRPIVVRGYTAVVIARPPEKVFELFD